MTLFIGKRAKLLMVPLARGLMRLGLSALALTILGFSAAVVAGVLFALGHPRLAALAVFVSGILDSADGTVARLSGGETRAGAFLDSAIDRYCEGVVFFGLLVNYLYDGALSSVLLTFGAMSGAFFVSYMRARLEGLGRECRAGVLERPDRVILLGAGALLGATGLLVALWLIAILSHFTALQRVRYAIRILRG
ncbi:MAG: CDP-alcohol phosphatidyltransferase family protein [Candidatus Eisenbacteria bacterium]